MKNFQSHAIKKKKKARRSLISITKVKIITVYATDEILKSKQLTFV